MDAGLCMSAFQECWWSLIASTTHFPSYTIPKYANKFRKLDHKNETLATFDLLLLHGLPAGIVEILHYYIYYSQVA